MEFKVKSEKRRALFHKIYIVLFWVIFVIALIDTYFSVFVHPKPYATLILQTIPYVMMLIILRLPFMLKKAFKYEMPWMLSAVIILFGFTTFMLGDALDFYGKFYWWSILHHAVSGIMMSIVAFWLIEVSLNEHSKYVYSSKIFLFVFVLMFPVGMGAFWEILEYVIDCVLGSNSQQFLASATGFIASSDEIPLVGHEALYDTMLDMILNFIGSLAVAVYTVIRHDKIIKAIQRYQVYEGAAMEIG